MTAKSSYAVAGVDTAAGDFAVELMKDSIARTQGKNVLGGIGGFAGLFDLSFAKHYKRPLLATSTDGVGTKLQIAHKLDIHDTVGQDLVGMVVDDIVTVGAKPLFMTDYIACGKVIPQRIAAIVRGIANACTETGVALIGGETAEHPGVMRVKDYDVAGAAVGIVEADRALGPDRVRYGDAVLAIASSGLHSNGFSLVRHILKQNKVDYTDDSLDLGSSWGEALLEPTRLYTAALLKLIEGEYGHNVHALAHVTGGGIAANLARVLPTYTFAEVDRSTWSPQPIFHALNGLAGTTLESTETVWNQGIGFFAVVSNSSADDVIAELRRLGLPAWQTGIVQAGEPDFTEAAWVDSAKGVTGGAVRLVGEYAGGSTAKRSPRTKRSTAAAATAVKRKRSTKAEKAVSQGQ